MTVVYAAASASPLVGDDGPDDRGNGKRDVIVANAARTTVNGRGGNDLICLGKGKDKAVGGSGATSARAARAGTRPGLRAGKA